MGRGVEAPFGQVKEFRQQSGIAKVAAHLLQEIGRNGIRQQCEADSIQ